MRTYQIMGLPSSVRVQSESLFQIGRRPVTRGAARLRDSGYAHNRYDRRFVRGRSSRPLRRALREVASRARGRGDHEGGPYGPYGPARSGNRSECENHEVERSTSGVTRRERESRRRVVAWRGTGPAPSEVGGRSDKRLGEVVMSRDGELTSADLRLFVTLAGAPRSPPPRASHGARLPGACRPHCRARHRPDRDDVRPDG